MAKSWNTFHELIENIIYTRNWQFHWDITYFTKYKHVTVNDVKEDTRDASDVDNSDEIRFYMIFYFYKYFLNNKIDELRLPIPDKPIPNYD